MPVQIHGKEYRTVAERVTDLRKDHPDWGIQTEMIYHDDEKVIFKAIIGVGGSVIGTGHAEEFRAASKINMTSATENCETSAIGRAASAAGYGGSGEYCSADELASALKAQAAGELLAYNELVREHFYAIAEAKSMLEPKWGANENQPDVTHARAVLKELGDDVYRQLWKAPTKGGIFTTQERLWLKEPPEGAL